MLLSCDSPLLPWKASGCLGGYPFLTATPRGDTQILWRLREGVCVFNMHFSWKVPLPPNKKFWTVPKPGHIEFEKPYHHRLPLFQFCQLPLCSALFHLQNLQLSCWQRIPLNLAPTPGLSSGKSVPDLFFSHTIHLIDPQPRESEKNVDLKYRPEWIANIETLSKPIMYKRV